jgi:hypothetical protein
VSPKMVEHPGKRTNPAKLKKDQLGILSDIESRVGQDVEDPEIRSQRIKRYAPPRRRGSVVLNNPRKNPNTA